MADMKQYIISFQATLKGHKMVLSSLKGMERQVKGVIATEKIGANVSKQYTKVLDTQGKVVGTVTTRINKIGNVIQKHVRTVDKAGVATNKYTTTTKAAGKASKNYGQQVGALVKRAAMVIPVWLVLRQSFMMLMRTITEGLKYWEQFDKAMMKSKAVIHGVSMDIDTVMGDLEKRIQSLAIETGTAMDKISSTFYRFGTVGIEFEESWEGAKTSVRTAMAMMGDADKIARVLAISYKLLGDTIDDSIPSHLRLESVGAKLYALWRINAFEIDELAGALERFIPTANTANFTLDETVALLAALHSAGLKGTRAGRLLRSSIDKLVANLDRLATTLKIRVDPGMENTFEVFMGVLRVLDRMAEAKPIPKETIDAIREIFGGVRGGAPIKALITLYKGLQKNLEITGATGKELEKLLEEFGDRIDEVTKSIHRQTEIARELRKQIGLAFLQGLLGGKDFAETLQNLNKILKRTMYWGSLLGEVIKIQFLIATAQVSKISDVFKEAREKSAKEIRGLMDDIKKAVRGEISVPELDELIEKLELPEVKLRIEKTGVSYEAILNSLKKVKEEVELATEEIERMEFEVERVNTATFLRLEMLRKGTEYLKMQLGGYSELQIAQEKLNDYTSSLVDKYNQLMDINGQRVKQLSTEQILALAMKEDWESVLELTKEQVIDGDKILKIAKLISNVEKERINEYKLGLKIINTLEQAEVDLLKAAGASQSYILEIQEKRLQINLAQISPYEQQNRLLDIQIQKELALQQRILKRRDLYVTVMEKILSASEEERETIEKAITTLLPKKGRNFILAFKGLSEEAQAAAISIMNIFAPFQRIALVKARVEVAGLKGMSRAVEEAIRLQPEMDIKLMRATELQIDRLILHPEAQKALEVGYTMRPTGGVTGVEAKYPGVPYIERVPIEIGRKLPTPELKISISIGGIDVELPPKTTLKNVAEAIGLSTYEEVVKKLQTDPEFARLYNGLFTKNFWNEQSKGH